MDFEILKAHNGEETLKVNNLLLYSKYRPFEEAKAFIQKEMNFEAKGYLLIGLGLGYHLKALYTLAAPKSQITIFLLDDKEILLYENTQIYQELRGKPNITFVSNIEDLIVNSEHQIIIPYVWMQVMETDHKLYPFLFDIKMKQMSYKRFEVSMEANFYKNNNLNDFNLPQISEYLKGKKIACLISAGPSLHKTLGWLQDLKKDVLTISVGSALKSLLNKGIIPDAVIITDSQDEILQQLSDCNYQGYLFYLCTANHETVLVHKYARCILFQNGYTLAEELAHKLHYPTLDTGGSVATTAFSLLEYLKVENLFLFGQDLGFKGNVTHVLDSTSGRIINENEKLQKIRSNGNELINTTPNLNSYLRWFERKIKDTTINNVYNTALDGAKIDGVPLINKEQFMLLTE